MKAKDGHVLVSKSPEFSYEGFEEFPVPGTELMKLDERESWSLRLTTILRRRTPHPHVRDLTSLMHDVLKRGEPPLSIEHTREILGGNHHFRVRSVKGEGDKAEHMVIVTEGPEQRQCPKCAEEERWHGATRSREKHQPGGRRHRHGSCDSPAAAVDYSQL